MPIRGVTLFLFGGVAEMGMSRPRRGTSSSWQLLGRLLAASWPSAWVLGLARLLRGLAATRGYHPRRPSLHQHAGPGLQSDSGVPSRRRPRAPLDSLECDRGSAASHSLGRPARSGLRLAVDRVGRPSVLYGQSARQYLDGADWHVPERRGAVVSKCSCDRRSKASRAPLHEPGPDCSATVTRP